MQDSFYRGSFYTRYNLHVRGSLIYELGGSDCGFGEEMDNVLCRHRQRGQIGAGIKRHRKTESL